MLCVTQQMCGILPCNTNKSKDFRLLYWKYIWFYRTDGNHSSLSICNMKQFENKYTKQELLTKKSHKTNHSTAKKGLLCRYALIQIWFMQKSSVAAIFRPWATSCDKATSCRMSRRECDNAGGNRATMRLFHRYFSTHLSKIFVYHFVMHFYIWFISALFLIKLFDEALALLQQKNRVLICISIGMFLYK